jgi:hypothetical protein
MKYDEILTEMAFTRKRIIRSLESYDTRIFEHATKIILMPTSQDVGHWKRELLAWAGYLASLRLRVEQGKGQPSPMGYDLAYEYLYRGPFEGNELGMTAHFIRMVSVAHRIRPQVAVEDVHRQLQAFLVQLSHDIGEGDEAKVEATINALGTAADEDG